MDMSNSFLLGGMGADADKVRAQHLAFPMMDFSAFNPFAMPFPAAAFMNALPTMPGAQGFSPMAPFFDMTAFAGATSLPMFAPQMLEPLPQSPESAATGSPSLGLGSPLDSPFVPSAEFLSPMMGSPASSVLSSPSTAMSSPAAYSAAPTPVPGSASGQAKKKKKRKPKPKMAELPQDEAQAKRDSNRESARKCRERKRDREKTAMDENDILRKEVAELKLKVQVLTSLLLEKDALVAQATKRQRLE